MVVKVYSWERVRPAAGGKILLKDLVLTFFLFLVTFGSVRIVWGWLGPLVKVHNLCRV